MKPDLFEIGIFKIHGYGFMIAIGFLAAFLVAELRAKRKNMNVVAVGELIMHAVVFGFLGAKILYVFVNIKVFLESPIEILGSSGFVVYGGIAAGIIAGIFYCRRKNLSFLEHFDLLAPEVAIAQGFGRIGCHLAGCCYGKITDSKFAVIFPPGSMAPAGVPLIPVQLISAVGDFIITLILLLLSERKKGLFSKKGSIAAVYIMLYSVGRFIVEFFRNDNRGSIGILSTSQFLSLFFAAAAIIMLSKRCIKDFKN